MHSELPRRWLHALPVVPGTDGRSSPYSCDVPVCGAPASTAAVAAADHPERVLLRAGDPHDRHRRQAARLDSASDQPAPQPADPLLRHRHVHEPHLRLHPLALLLARGVPVHHQDRQARDPVLGVTRCARARLHLTYRLSWICPTPISAPFALKGPVLPRSW
ncbi:hypothetical protein ANCDUO_04125 [Ancylostoma duodenale]|uniref:Uncharacterized protein n=1 Tax=Ancylostoma duodenale TaxID=51022 RepID=A0A0C2GVR5_9BILA|nr:hypothetical protein ANCDUO_04125 [Ancylostoma duodenale]